MDQELTAHERAAAPASLERTALLIAVLCTVVMFAALLIPKVHGIYAGLAAAAPR